MEFAVGRGKVIGCRLLVVTRLEIVDEFRNLARSAKDPVEAAPAPVNRGLRAPVDERHGFATTRLPRHAADRERMVRQVAEIEPADRPAATAFARPYFDIALPVEIEWQSGRASVWERVGQ